MLEKVEITYAHIPSWNAQQYVTDDGKYQFRVSIQYERQNPDRQTVALANARGEEYIDHISDTQFTLQECYDFTVEDLKTLITKVKKEQAGYNYQIK